MPDRLLRKKDIAERLGTSERNALTLLAAHGCHPIDFGAGRGRGLRWLESAVDAAMRSMHQAAQPAPIIQKNKKVKAPKGISNLASMSAAEVYELIRKDSSKDRQLTGCEPVQ